MILKLSIILSGGIIVIDLLWAWKQSQTGWLIALRKARSTDTRKVTFQLPGFFLLFSRKSKSVSNSLWAWACWCPHFPVVGTHGTGNYYDIPTSLLLVHTQHRDITMTVPLPCCWYTLGTGAPLWQKCSVLWYEGVSQKLCGALFGSLGQIRSHWWPLPALTEHLHLLSASHKLWDVFSCSEQHSPDAMMSQAWGLSPVSGQPGPVFQARYSSDSCFLACSKMKRNIKNKMGGSLHLNSNRMLFSFLDSGVRNVRNKSNLFEPLYVL